MFLTFIHVPDDGSAEPKHVAYWHNLGLKWCSVQNKYMLWCVRLFIIIIITAIEVTHWDDRS
jgi:hypothetical protein